MECAICYKKIKKEHWICKYCNNKLHNECYSNWLEYSDTCPFCREQMKESTIIGSIFCYSLVIGICMRIFNSIF